MDTSSYTTQHGTFAVGENVRAQLCDAPHPVEAQITRIQVLGDPQWAKFHVRTKRGTVGTAYEKDVRKP